MAFSNDWLGNRATIALLVGCVLGISGCNSGPPQRFFVTGEMKPSGEAVVRIKDVYIWRQPSGSGTVVLLSDRVLPPLPAEDTFPVVDLGLMFSWSRAPLGELTLDAQGKLIGYAMRDSTGGGESAACAQNGDACHSAVDYWNPHADWGDDTMAASYEFGHAVDVALAQSIHRQTQFQTPVLSGRGERIDSQGKPTRPAPDDHANMFVRYQRVREALDENSAQAFLDANGYDAGVATAMLKFDGIAAGIARLAASCPHIERYESFGNDGGFGSLLIHDGDAETAVYFIRRGEEWVLQQCGSS